MAAGAPQGAPADVSLGAKGAEGLVRVASSRLPCDQDCVADCTGGLRTRESGLFLGDLCQEH